MLNVYYFLSQGYTPLHLAMQYEHEDIFDLLVQVYGEWFKASYCRGVGSSVLVVALFGNVKHSH